MMQKDHTVYMDKRLVRLGYKLYFYPTCLSCTTVTLLILFSFYVAFIDTDPLLTKFMKKKKKYLPLIWPIAKLAKNILPLKFGRIMQMVSYDIS